MMFDPDALIEQKSMPHMSQLYISSERYVAKIYFVSKTIGGNCLKIPTSKIPIDRSVHYLYLVGAFVGIELAPRLLLLRENDKLYKSIGCFNQGAFVINYFDFMFERKLQETFWRI